MATVRNFDATLDKLSADRICAVGNHTRNRKIINS